MEIEDYRKELAKSELEIEELSIQLADMLGAALHFAGVSQDNIPKAVEAYLHGIDEVYGEEDGEMGFKEIISVINHLKDKKSSLFSS